MSAKVFITGGAVIGSTIGQFLPSLWGDGSFSISAILLSFIFGLVGIWAGHKIYYAYFD